MQVQHVERVPGEPAPDPGVGDRAERDPGDRPVVAARGTRAGRRDDDVAAGASARSSSAGARTRHLVAERDQRLGEVEDVDCTPPGTSKRVRAHDPDPHRSRPRSMRAPDVAGSVRRSTPAAACASPAGASRCSAANASASACVAVATSVAAAVCRGHRRPGGPIVTAQPSGRERTRNAGSEQRAGARGEQRRARRHPRRLAEERHLEPARGQVPVGDAGRPGRRRAAARASVAVDDRRRSAASISMPRPSR